MTIEKIDEWDWPDYGLKQDGYDHVRVATLSVDNMNLIADKLNEVIDAINEITGEDNG